MKNIFPAIILQLILWLGLAFACACHGCLENKPQMRPTDASTSLGGSIKGAWGHTESANYDATEAGKAITTDTGKSFISAVLFEHAAVFKDLTTAGNALDIANAEYKLAVVYGNKIDGQLAAEKIAHTNDVAAIKNSLSYRIGHVLLWAAGIIAAWLIIVHTFPLIGLMLGGPVGGAISGFGRLVNVAGWGQNIADKVRIKQALMTPVPAP